MKPQDLLAIDVFTSCFLENDRAITTPLVTRFGGGTSKCNSTILFCFPPPFLQDFRKLEGGGKKVTSAADKTSNTGKTSKCNITF